MKMLPVRFILTVAVFLATVSCHPTAQANLPNLSNGAVIESIQVAGNRSISSEAIMAKIQTKTGDKINTAAIQRDITSVRSLGFEDVRVAERDGVSGGKIIMFSVTEKPPKPTS
jgi:outer membrane protein assembly factor BamA